MMCQYQEGQTQSKIIYHITKLYSYHFSSPFHITYILPYACTHIYTHTHMCTCIYTYPQYIYIQIHMHTCTHTYTHMHMYTHGHIYKIHIHIDTHTRRSLKGRDYFLLTFLFYKRPTQCPAHSKHLISTLDEWDNLIIGYQI